MSRLPSSHMAARGRAGSSVRHVHEAAVVALEGDRDVRGGAVAVLDQHDVGLAGPRAFLFLLFFPGALLDNVGVLLVRARFAKAGGNRLLVLTLSRPWVELALT